VTYGDPTACNQVAREIPSHKVLSSVGRSSTSITVNGESVGADAHVEVAALDFDDPSCVPSSTTACPAVLNAFQIYFTEEFLFDDLAWQDGVLTMESPLPIVYDIAGLFAEVPFTASFNVSHACGEKRAVSSAVGHLSLIVLEDGGSALYEGQHTFGDFDVSVRVNVALSHIATD
jgi:hypothetical protein